MFNKIKESLKPFLPAGNPGVPPNPIPEPPPRPKGSGKVHPTIGPPPNPKNETPAVELELWIQSK